MSDFIERNAAEYNILLRSLRKSCGLTFDLASADSGISRSVLENIEYRSNMNFHSYMQLHLFYTDYLHYRFDHALFNQFILDCIRTRKNLVLLEVDDDELEAYRAKGEVLMEKEEQDTVSSNGLS